ncbi:hypothetical protein L4C34_02960 [Vibrio profundum]|uniref:hypothetical protein n=1 Tax=Vibrio profundum TaxID=2910247 RepID=UPI003D105B88
MIIELDKEGFMENISSVNNGSIYDNTTRSAGLLGHLLSAKGLDHKYNDTQLTARIILDGLHRSAENNHSEAIELIINMAFGLGNDGLDQGRAEIQVYAQEALASLALDNIQANDTSTALAISKTQDLLIQGQSFQCEKDKSKLVTDKFLAENTMLVAIACKSIGNIPTPDRIIEIRNVVDNMLSPYEDNIDMYNEKAIEPNWWSAFMQGLSPLFDSLFPNSTFSSSNNYSGRDLRCSSISISSTNTYDEELEDMY